MSEPSADPQPTGTPARPVATRGAGGTAKNMVWTLLPLVALVVVVTLVFAPRGHHPLPTVDPQADIGFARHQAKEPVPVARGLGAGWRVTSSSVLDRAPLTLRIGYQTPSGGFARYADSVGTLPALLAANLSDPHRTGVVRIGDRSWTSYGGASGQGGLATRIGTISVVVSGTAPTTELRALAASLAP